MLCFTSPVVLRLERGRLLTWSRQSGVCLRVITGTAWVTQADDMEDHFLRPGQTLHLRPGARAILGAEQEVSLSFEADGDLFADLLTRLRLRPRREDGRARHGAAPGMRAA